MPDLADFPNCSTRMKSGMFGSVSMLKQFKIRIIDEYVEPKQTGVCSKCGSDLYDTALQRLNAEEGTLNRTVVQNISSIPILTISNPQYWEYDILGMVAGQSTTGTGILSEFASSSTDLPSRQSKSYSTKLRNGEVLCFTHLRKATLNLRGNAIIGTDIDYAEVGGDKLMLMVCMAGTSIKFKDLSVLNEASIVQMGLQNTATQRLQYLNSLDNSGLYN